MSAPRILIVEDRPLTARLLVESLESIGCVPLGPCDSADKAIAAAESLHPDLALMDVQLASDRDGVATAEVLKERFGVRCVMMTALEIGDVLPRSGRASPVGFLNKPFTATTLHTTIQMALHLRDVQSQLQQNQSTLAAMLQTAPDGLLVLDLGGRILEANDAACRLMAHPHEQLLQTSIFSLCEGNCEGPMAASLEAKLSQRAPRTVHSCYNAEGRQLEVTVYAQLQSVARDRYVCYIRDVTETRQAQEAIRNLSRAVEQSPVSIVITDRSGQIEYVNPHFEQVSGYSVAEAKGQNPRILKSGEQPAEFYANLWATISSGGTWHGEFYNRRKNRECYWESASISPVRDATGRISHFIAVKEDITERKRIARDLELRRSYLLAMIENQPGSAWLKDLQGAYLAANRNCAENCGRSEPSELIGLHVEDLTPELGSITDLTDAEVRENGWVYYSLLVPRNGDTSAWLEIYKSVARDAAGKPIGIAGFGRDVTSERNHHAQLLASQAELEHANARLTESIARTRELAHEATAANRAKTAFLTSMSHELRTPLNVINGVSATMQREFAGTKTGESAGLILECGNHLLGIISEILDFSVLHSEHAKLHIQKFALLDTVLATLRQLSVPVAQKGLTLSYWIAPETPIEIETDARRLQQILINLVQNAVKFTEHGGIHVSVSGRSAADGKWRWCFSVSDSGIGIHRAHIEKLFVPFAQATGEIARTYGGTGLGLAISRSFARLLGGDIVVRSRRGRGSTFRCTITTPAPAAQACTIADLAPERARDLSLVIVASDSRCRRELLALAKAWSMRPEVFSPAEWSAGKSATGKSSQLAIVEEGTAEPPPPSHGPVIWLDHMLAGRQVDAHHGPRLRCPLDIRELVRALDQVLTPGNDVQVRPSSSVDGPLPKLGERIPLRILAADDLHSNREVLRRMLQFLGYQPDLCADGEQLLAALEREPYDLLFIDVQMPVMDGLTAARVIRRRFGDNPTRPRLVALTANALAGDREKCVEAGMDDYLPKPVIPSDIEACIHRLFSGAPKRTDIVVPSALPAESEDPLLDRSHLRAAFGSLNGSALLDVLAQLEAAVMRDYASGAALLAEACEQRDAPALGRVLHAMKGCFLNIGWKRLAQACADALQSVREHRFQAWQTLPTELHDLVAASEVEFGRYLGSLGTPTRGGTAAPALGPRNR